MKIPATALVFFVLIFNQATFADIISANDAAVINRFEPSSLLSIKDAIAKGDQRTEVAEFINLADRIDGQLTTTNEAALTGARKNDLYSLCGTIWNIGIKIFPTLTDDQDRQTFLSFWKSSLQKHSARIQIAALGDTMDRQLMTSEVWSVLDKTDDSSTLSAFAYLVWKQGTDEDVKHLQSKMDSLKSDEQKGILANGINYRNWRLSGSPYPGPAHGVPYLL